jgi:hypothetical protein
VNASPPDTIAPFAPGVIETDGDEYGLVSSPDGQTVYFVRRIARDQREQIMESRFVNGSWSAPVALAFSTGGFVDKEPYLTRDGRRMFFASTRRVPGAATFNPEFDLWVTERTDRGWGAPQHLGTPLNSPAYENYPAVADNGTLYFSSKREGGAGGNDLYRAAFVNGAYSTPENLGPAINTPASEADPYVAPDESYLIFSSTRPGGLGSGDLYITFRTAAGWTAPRNLGPRVNSSAYEYTPFITPNGKALILSRDWGDVRWIATSQLSLTP